MYMFIIYRLETFIKVHLGKINFSSFKIHWDIVGVYLRFIGVLWVSNEFGYLKVSLENHWV